MDAVGIIIVLSQITIQAISYFIGQTIGRKQQDENATMKMMILSGVLTSLIFGFRQGFIYLIISISAVVLIQAGLYILKKGGKLK